ncbi:5'-nucleotidase C-terminal domain-containing protein [Dysgonomonas sp. 520]|uniref:5'-nucleotidase C-terminal domain-containing protein n=1 Tax=Dysgonomonas sp. 520 TaxID=2302931 RepID=UPI0013D158C5|nr:5'-nucleotidase C-terminal domain-containing protein [Dysgonomonas sp. 520]NDW08138.1 5'-nucleotidase [Dysgonomonas sp. 520]
MKKRLFFLFIILLTISACKQQRYGVTSMRGERILLDGGFDKNRNTSVVRLVDHYKQQIDREMSVIIGQSSQYMEKGRPESLLTNLTSDLMKAEGDKFTNDNCDLALMNVDGHRASLPKGDITIGNMYEIFSFENALVLAKLRGSVLNEIFESYAKMGGAGISSSAKLVISKDGKLVSALINGQAVDKDKVYSVVTLDYLAGGNDGMEALKKADSIEPLNITLRDAMMNYIKQKAKEGKVISSVLDERIVVKE